MVYRYIIDVTLLPNKKYKAHIGWGPNYFDSRNHPPIFGDSLLEVKQNVCKYLSEKYYPLHIEEFQNTTYDSKYQVAQWLIDGASFFNIVVALTTIDEHNQSIEILRSFQYNDEAYAYLELLNHKNQDPNIKYEIRKVPTYNH